MAISIPQMQRVIDAGAAVPALLREALPSIGQAGKQLDDFVRVATTDTPVGIVYRDVVLERIKVRDSIDAAMRVLGKVEGAHLAKSGVGPASDAVKGAKTAMTELTLARTQLDSSIDVYTGMFGGVHAALRETNAAAVDTHLGKAYRAAQSALRAHVNG